MQSRRSVLWYEGIRYRVRSGSFTLDALQLGFCPDMLIPVPKCIYYCNDYDFHTFKPPASFTVRGYGVLLFPPVLVFTFYRETAAVLPKIVGGRFLLSQKVNVARRYSQSARIKARYFQRAVHNVNEIICRCYI